MTCQSDIENVAAQKILDAECLLIGGRFDGAYYLAGYAIELLLKAKICKTLGIADFFDFDNKDRSVKIKNDNSVFRTHNYEQLLILSGIYMDYKNEQDPEFKTNWSIVVEWNENSRYLINRTSQECIIFVESVKEIIIVRDNFFKIKGGANHPFALYLFCELK